MKLLMFHVRDFWFKTYEKNLDSAEEQLREGGLAGGDPAQQRCFDSGEPHRGRHRPPASCGAEDGFRESLAAVEAVVWLAQV